MTRCMERQHRGINAPLVLRLHGYTHGAETEQVECECGSGYLGQSWSAVGPLHSQGQRQALMQMRRSLWISGTPAAELPSPCEQTCDHSQQLTPCSNHHVMAFRHATETFVTGVCRYKEV